jgi:hypothetical protein
MLQTFGVLLGIWFALALTALLLGEMPVETDRGTPPRESDDAGTYIADAGSIQDAGSYELDAGEAEIIVDAGTASPRLRPHRWIVCPEPAIAPSLMGIDLIGDGRTELVVGCGDRWEVFSIREGTPIRVARVDTPPGEGDPNAGPAIAVDFDGDERRDLVLPLARYGAGGATRGGGLFVVPRDRFGGFDPPRALAPIAAVAIAAGAIISQSPRDLAVIHQANPFARLPSEVWVFAGGSSPSRRSVLRTGVGASGLGLGDLNLDGKLDIIVSSSDDARVDIFAGDGSGSFPHRQTLSVVGATNIVVGDTDGDGSSDAVIEASGIALIPARRAQEGELEAMRIESAPSNIRGVALAQLDSDPEMEIIGWDSPRLLAFERIGETWESRVRIELGRATDGTAELGARRHLVTDIDGDGNADVVLLGVSAIDGPRMLELVFIPGLERGVVDVGERREILDAPWVLRVPLPEAQAL